MMFQDVMEEAMNIFQTEEQRLPPLLRQHESYIQPQRNSSRSPRPRSHVILCSWLPPPPRGPSPPVGPRAATAEELIPDNHHMIKQPPHRNLLSTLRRPYPLLSLYPFSHRSPPPSPLAATLPSHDGAPARTDPNPTPPGAHLPPRPRHQGRGHQDRPLGGGHHHQCWHALLPRVLGRGGRDPTPGGGHPRHHGAAHHTRLATLRARGLLLGSPVRHPHGVAVLMGRISATRGANEVVGGSDTVKVVELDAPMTQEEALSFSTARGWPSTSYFVDGEAVI
jgi:hypothetical protein